MPKIRRLAASEREVRSPWDSLVARLHGLVTVETDAPFHDLELLCLRDARLVLHLDLILVTPHNRHLSRLVKQALDALAVLCVQSERMRVSEKRYEEFWRRMITSDMSRKTIEPNDISIIQFARFTRLKGLRVLLSWDTRAFQACIVQQIREFLEGTVVDFEDLANTIFAGERPGKWSSVRPVVVGIRVADCNLTLRDVVAICEWVFADSTSTGRRLCDSSRLAMLDLQGNRLGEMELSAIASLLETTTKQIDGLGFRNTFPTEETEAIRPAYIAQFKRVLSAALATANLRNGDPGLALSLAQNVMFDGLHLQALYEVLEHAK